jgi:hypothetical protein
MAKNFKLLFMFVILFTTMGLFYNCSDDNTNQPPATPSNPSPANNEDSVSQSSNLTWSICADPDNDSVKYDVYLGISANPSLVSSNILLNSYKPDTLLAQTKYYWKVVAKDNKNNAATSPVWSFTTLDAPPGDLKVIVCNVAGTAYYGDADVYIYKSYSERLNDASRTSYFRKASTDNTDPHLKGAIFYALVYQQYYLFCSWTNGTVTYTGEKECFVPKGQMSTCTVKIQ